MFLYDTDSGVNGPAKRTYTVTESKPVKITAAGLAPGECVQVYVRAGQAAPSSGCGSCNAPDDWLWAPLNRCGTPVKICGDSNQIIELVPGTYMLGPITPDPVFAGDVNIVLEPMDKMAKELLCCVAKCDPPLASPLPVEVISSCADPVNVNVCNPPIVGIESAFAPLGCIVDGSNNLTGKVFLCKDEIDQVGATPTFSMVSVALDGTVTTGYTGAWVDCSALDKCQPIINRGLLAAW